ncbi:hypothetical protein FB451DRAFT_1055183 [Mycena latifolia]|nr:hypothetical protein FB451DRAFT_1055183 [Mycena latifolia]
MSSIGRVVFVAVGAESDSPGGPLQFNPNTLTAPNGTSVTFQFSRPRSSPGNHSVVQSSLAAPCTPVLNGFDSGFRLVPENNSGDAASTFAHTVNNDQEPLWFFCRQSVPDSHCHAGMVGAINTPDSQTFAAFESTAEGTSTSQSQSSSLAVRFLHPTPKYF